ncbi:unnamed protein product [Microthlaspi erraticum]|uniref:Potassium channel domain-containing protein n=1 Tax=Microthlaspi erraticum TaxID=1685480 RepID=A0A6D2ID91_9BRAS|nr:unnamed protein product [Microthlaspi erraticum]
MIIVSTVGYGDFAFKSLGGRIFAAFWILSTTISMACLLMRWAEMKTEMTDIFPALHEIPANLATQNGNFAEVAMASSPTENEVGIEIGMHATRMSLANED